MSDKAKPRGSMVEQTCANALCGKAFPARAADVARGWAKCCSKSCSSIRREQVKAASKTTVMDMQSI